MAVKKWDRNFEPHPHPLQHGKHINVFTLTTKNNNKRGGKMANDNNL